MITIKNDPNYKFHIELISYSIRGHVLDVLYSEIVELNGKEIRRNEILKTYCALQYLDNDIVEQILKNHYE